MSLILARFSDAGLTTMCVRIQVGQGRGPGWSGAAATERSYGLTTMRVLVPPKRISASLSPE